MNPRPWAMILPLVALVAAGAAVAGQGAIEHLQTYRQQGVEHADPERGRQLWFSTHNGRGCTSCHGEDLTTAGRHAKTGKTIEPMAPSVNPARYTSGKTIEKWFLRNCKWTFARECSAQEKADILSWLSNR